jgi:hypothetical protein
MCGKGVASVGATGQPVHLFMHRLVIRCCWCLDKGEIQPGEREDAGGRAWPGHCGDASQHLGHNRLCGALSDKFADCAMNDGGRDVPARTCLRMAPSEPFCHTGARVAVWKHTTAQGPGLGVAA